MTREQVKATSCSLIASGLQAVLICAEPHGLRYIPKDNRYGDLLDFTTHRVLGYTEFGRHIPGTPKARSGACDPPARFARPELDKEQPRQSTPRVI